MKLSTRISSCAAALLAGTLMLSACSGGDATDTDEPGNAEVAAGDEEASTNYPLTVTNCDAEVVFEEAPERVLMLSSVYVPLLDGIDVLDRVFMKAGEYPAEYYDDDLAKQVEEIPQLTDDLDASGHLLISQEEIVAQEPDLLVGLPDGVSRESMEDAGINVLDQEMYCPGASKKASFEFIYDEVERLGKIFDHVDEADAQVEELKERVQAVEDDLGDYNAKTAVALYPTVGGGTLYAYGNSSMVQAQFEALDLENLFEDNNERVFEIQSEVLIDMDPDVILVLYQGAKEAIENEVTSLPGADEIVAVKEDRVIYELFNFTEPASPLTVTGLERLATELQESTN